MSSDAPGESAAAALIVENLRAIGLEVEQRAIPTAEFDQVVATNGCQVCLRRVSSSVPAYEGVAGRLLGTEPWDTANTSGYDSPCRPASVGAGERRR